MSAILADSKCVVRHLQFLVALSSCRFNGVHRGERKRLSQHRNAYLEVRQFFIPDVDLRYKPILFVKNPSELCNFDGRSPLVERRPSLGLVIAGNEINGTASCKQISFRSKVGGM
jgi:hypothetical protein